MNQAEQEWRIAATNPGELETLQPRLLVSDLYTLVPTGIAPPEWQLWQHPSGVAAVPCFLSEASARLAARGAAQVVRVPGRELFASLDVVAAWVDPEGAPFLLLPAQLRGLMAAMPAPPEIGHDSTLELWTGAGDLSSSVRSVLCSLLAQFPDVTAAYWLGREEAGRLAHRRLIIVTQAGDGDGSARALHAISTALRANLSGPMNIEAQVLSHGDLPMGDLRLQSIEPFYLLDGPTT